MTKQRMAEVRRKDLKQCGVCGDHALGSNFNAITCESCKAFFRRNALKTKEFKCPFDGNCKVDVVTRRFCQKCRLRKCFDIGMKKEWIMTEEEKKAKREKIEKNRQKRSGHSKGKDSLHTEIAVYIKTESPEPLPVVNEVLSPVSAMSPLTPQTPGSMPMSDSPPCRTKMFAHQPLTPSDCEYSPPAKLMIVDSSLISSESDASEILDSCSNNDSGIGSVHASNEIKTENSSPIQQPSLPEDEIICAEEVSNNVSSAISSPNPTNTQDDDETVPDSVYAKGVAVEFVCLSTRREGTNPGELNILEINRLQELIVANEVLKMPLACGVTDPSLLDVINMTDHAIRRLIKMSKKIDSFKTLCQVDQIALLKGGCTELMILRSVMTYDPEKECWRHGPPRGPMRMSIKVDVLKEAKGNVYEEHKRFINSFRPEWRADENIMLLLSAVALFTPERPNVVHKDTIRLEQDTYYYLLRRYLETILDVCNAKSTFLKLVHRLEQLHILNENHVRVYLDVNPKDVEPLLIEIFDLKH